MAQSKVGQPVSRRLGDLLVNEGLITQENLQRALAEQKGSNEKLGSIPVRLGALPENQRDGFPPPPYRPPRPGPPGGSPPGAPPPTPPGPPTSRRPPPSARSSPPWRGKPPTWSSWKAGRMSRRRRSTSSS